MYAQTFLALIFFCAGFWQNDALATNAQSISMDQDESQRTDVQQNELQTGIRNFGEWVRANSTTGTYMSCGQWLKVELGHICEPVAGNEEQAFLRLTAKSSSDWRHGLRVGSVILPQDGRTPAKVDTWHVAPDKSDPDPRRGWQFFTFPPTTHTEQCFYVARPLAVDPPIYDATTDQLCSHVRHVPAVHLSWAQLLASLGLARLLL